MPGLSLTLAQARRLWSLDEPTSLVILERLVREGFLRRAGDGGYRRAGGGC